MSSLTIFLAKLLGLYCILIALAMMTQKNAMVAAVAGLFQDPPAVILAGVIALGVGLAIILGHNVWTGSALAVVVTISGWLSAIKGVVLLTLQPGAQHGYFAALHYGQYFYFYTGFTLLLGVYLTYGGFVSGREASQRRTV